MRFAKHGLSIFVYPIWVNYALNNITDVTPKIVNRKDIPTKPQSDVRTCVRHTKPNKSWKALNRDMAQSGKLSGLLVFLKKIRFVAKTISFKLPLVFFKK